MNFSAEEMQSRKAGGPSPHLALVLILAILLVGAGIAQPSLDIPSEHYDPIHTLAEAFSVILAGLVFAAGWYSWGERRPGNAVLVSCGFLAVALLDLGHLLSLPDMPPFLTPSGPEKALDFWLSARLTAAASLLFVALTPWRPLKSVLGRRVMLALALALAGLVFWAVLVHPARLPHTFVPQRGVTVLKLALEHLVVVMLVVTALILWRRQGEQHVFDARNLFAGAATLAMSEIWFTLYAPVTDVYSLMGHVYKVMGLAFIYASVLHDSVRRPQEALRAEQARVKAALEAAEARFRAMADTVPNIVYTKDSGGELDYFNASFTRYTGLPVEEGLGRGLARLLHPDDVEATLKAKTGAERAGKPFNMKCRLRGADGMYRWFLLGSHPHFDEAGRVVKWYGVATDIQEMVDREEQVAENEALLRALFESSRDAILCADMEGRFLKANRAAEELTGYSEQELRQLHYLQLTPPRWHAMNAAVVHDQVMEQGRSDVFEKEYLRKDGTIVPVEMALSLIRSPCGKPMGVWGIVRDVGERKRAEQALRESSERYAKLMEAVASLVWTADAQGRIADAESSWERYTGRVGRRGDPALDGESVHPDDRGRALGEWNEAIARGQAFSLELRLWHATSHGYRTVRVRGVPLCGDDAQVREWIGTVTDVDDLAHAEEALRHAHEFLQMIVDHAPVAMLVWDAQQHLSLFSPAAERLFGWTAADVVGKSLESLNLVHEDDLPAVRPVAAELLSGRQRYLKQCNRNYTRDGTVIECEWHNSAAVGADGQVLYVISFATDVTERNRNERELRGAQAKLQTATEIAELGFWERDLDTGTSYMSPQWKRQIGYGDDEIGNNHEEWKARVHPDDLDRVQADVERYLADPTASREVEYRLRHKDGSYRWIASRMASVTEGSRVRKLVGTHQDITRRKHAEERLSLAAKALENAGEGVLIAREGRIVSVNHAFTEITGYAPEEVIGQYTRMLNSERHEQERVAARRAAVARDGQWQGEIWSRRKNGEVFPAWVSLSTMDDPVAGRHYVSVFSDISASKAQEERLEYLAHHDPLTGLPNRGLFQERLRDAAIRAARHRHVLGVLFIDLDRFKPVNDTLGHEAGDELLRLVAARLKSCVRAADTVARLGGDEFAVLLDELHTPEEAGLVARNMLDMLEQPFTLCDRPNHISASIGVSCYPQDGETAATLLRHADMAMYQAKQEGRAAYRFYSRDMNAHAAEKVYLANSLRLALERRELRLNYQPRLDLATGDIVGIEALVRWQHPEQGLILPARFISLAEETGLIQPIGEWVLREAARSFRAWRQAGLAEGRISVNLSPKEFAQPDLVERILAVVEGAGLAPTDLELEIPESMLTQDPERAGRVLGALASRGVRLALDNFGTGPSSLFCLKRFPVGNLKVDRSFVAGLPTDQETAALTRAIVCMAKSLELTITAEGVENEAHWHFLRECGCDAGQGHFFSPPLDEEGMGRFIEAKRVAGSVVAAG